MQNLFSSLVITLREGVEGALAVGIILLYLRKTGRSYLSSALWWGLALALIASIMGAALLEKLAFNQEIFEGILMFVAAFFVTTMIVWMWKTSRGLKKEIENKIESIAGNEDQRKGSAWLGIFLFTFLMIVREGIETVIFLSAVGLTTDKMVNFAGGLIGLALAVVFGIFFVRGSIKLDLGRFFKITGIVLIIFVLQLIIGGIHELSEGGLIDIGPRGMAFVGPIVKNNALFLMGVVSIPILMLLIPAQTKAVDSTSHADRRLQLAAQKRQKMWRTGSAILALSIMVFIGIDFVYGQNRKLTPPTTVTAINGSIRIPISTINDGNLHRFILDGTPVRFIVMKVEANKIATALDACEICGTQGYIQEAGAVVCLNCAADINPATIGESGGCNPIKLHSVEQGGDLVIAASDLIKETKLFSGESHHH